MKVCQIWHEISAIRHARMRKKAHQYHVTLEAGQTLHCNKATKGSRYAKLNIRFNLFVVNKNKSTFNSIVLIPRGWSRNFVR